MNFEDSNFLEYLRKNYSYLYDVEMSVREIQENTGFGEVSMSFRIANNTVDKGSVFTTQEKLYVRRENNRLV